MPTINMRSSANIIKGQGVGSCYIEQVRLVKRGLSKYYTINVNSKKPSDIIHYHTINFNYYIERLLKRKKTSGIGYVHFLPDTLDDSLNLPKFLRVIIYKYLLTFYNSMDYLVTVNPTIVKRLKEYNVNKPEIIYIPNYVSEKEFYPQDDNKILQSKNKYKIKKDKFVIMCAGQLQTRKGVLDFVDVAKKIPDVEFIWAGGFSFGKISDGYKEIKLITDNPPKNVKFLGMIDRCEMVNIYNMADVMFLPSTDELFPMSILEALCCNKPLLLRDISRYNEILFDYYLKAKDIDGFVNIINTLKNDKELIIKWKQKSLECHSFYNEEKIVSMWKKMYDEAYRKLKEK